MDGTGISIGVGVVIWLVRQLAFPLGMVLLLRNASSIIGFFRGGSGSPNQQMRDRFTATAAPSNSKGRGISLTTSALVVVLLAALALLLPPTHKFDNIYQFLEDDTPSTAPSYLLQRACSDLPSLSLSGDKDSISKNNIYYNDSILSICLDLARNGDLKRDVYNSLGYKTWRNCDWCRDSPDYFIYFLPCLLSSYTLFLIFAGILSSFLNHSSTSLRILILLISFTSLSLELAVRAGMNSVGIMDVMMMEDYILNLPSSLSILFQHVESFHTILMKIRYLTFLFSTISLLLFISFSPSSSSPLNWSDERQILRTMIDLSRTSKHQKEGRETINTCFQRDEGLSVRAGRYWKERRESLKAFHKLREVKAVRRSILLKHNMPSLRASAKNWVSNVLAMAGHPPAPVDGDGDYQPWQDMEEADLDDDEEFASEVRNKLDLR